jgi:hypothetical protein
MRILLHLKAWAMFFLTSGIAFIVAAVSITLLFMEKESLSERLEPFLSFVTAFCLAVTAVWMYTLATQLQEKVPEPLREDLTRFKWIFLTGTVCMVIEYIMDETIDDSLFITASEKPAMYYPIKIANLVCSIFNIIFVSRQLSSIEHQREVKFGDYYGIFWAFMFQIIGVFWIQPRVNAIFADEKSFEVGGPIDRI